MSQFSFPLLQPHEVIASLADMDINLSEEALNKPTYELVRPIYETLVQALVGVTREEMQQPVFSAIDAVEYPELHDESIPAVAFLRNVFKLMRACGVPDFNLRDLYKPEGPRFRRNLSAIINFGKYREERLALFNGLLERAEGAMARKAELEGEIARMTEEMRALRAKRAAEEPDAARLEGELEGLFRQIQTLHAEQDQLQQDVRGLKTTYNELTDKAAARKLEVAKRREEGQGLRNNIVTSPEKLPRVLRELEENAERERALTAQAEKAGRALTARVDVMQRLERELERAVRGLEEVEEAVTRKKEVSHAVKALRARIEAGEGEVLSLTAQAQHLRRQGEAVADRLGRLEQQAELKREAVASNVQQHLAEKEAIEAENAAAILRMQENEIQARALSDRIRSLSSTHEVQLTTLVEKYQQLRAKVQEYHTSLLKTMTLPAPVTAMATAMM